MLEIRYSTKREKMDAMADISGSSQDLGTLRHAILKFLGSINERYFIEVGKNIKPDGWDFVLEGLEINQKGKSVNVSVLENKILKIKGSKRNLEIFADWLKFDDDAQSGYHSHYEYFEGNEYINPESIPLVVRIR